MDFLITLFAFFWFVEMIGAIFFWIYLWQLKEYHIGRFIDHFRTHNGKRIFLRTLTIIKVLLFFVIMLAPAEIGPAFFALLVVYTIEAFMFFRKLTTNTLRLPKFTNKTIWLTAVSLVIAISFLLKLNIIVEDSYWFVFGLLLFDILTPVFVSAVILLFQPLFVMLRNRILKKAKEKIQQHKNLLIIAITGSYGKTSTKEFLATILSQKYKVLATPKHANSEIGISQCILQELKPEHEIFIVEMGSYRKGGIDLLCNIAKPNIGMVTGVNAQHMALFGSMENLLSAEGGQELLHNLPKNGLLVVNGDNKYCVDLYKQATINKKLYAVIHNTIDSDIWAEQITVKKDAVSFVAMAKDKHIAHIDVNVLGRQNVQNLLGAILVAKGIGMTMEEISAACKHITQAQAGITLHHGVHGIEIIDSSYSSNPDGVMADLDYLAVFKQKKVVVMPCLIELGSKSKEAHRAIGKKIAGSCDLAIITTKDRFEELKFGAVQAGMKPEQIVLLENPDDAFAKITTFCSGGRATENPRSQSDRDKVGDAVLLEGRVPGKLIKLLNGKQI